MRVDIKNSRDLLKLSNISLPARGSSLQCIFSAPDTLLLNVISSEILAVPFRYVSRKKKVLFDISSAILIQVLFHLEVTRDPIISGHLLKGRVPRL